MSGVQARRVAPTDARSAPDGRQFIGLNDAVSNTRERGWVLGAIGHFGDSEYVNMNTEKTGNEPGDAV